MKSEGGLSNEEFYQLCVDAMVATKAARYIDIQEARLWGMRVQSLKDWPLEFQYLQVLR